MDHFELSHPSISLKGGIFHNGPIFITFQSGQHVTTVDNMPSFLKHHKHIHPRALASVGCQTPTSVWNLLWGGGEGWRWDGDTVNASVILPQVFLFREECSDNNMAKSIASI